MSEEVVDPVAVSGAVLGTLGTAMSIPALIVSSMAFSQANDLQNKNWTLHEPALVLGNGISVAPAGLVPLDGVELSAGDRVLLVSQTDASENGLWVAQDRLWIRPDDFAPHSTAGTAYVLVEQGHNGQGSAWLVVTPNASIDDDPIQWQLVNEGNLQLAPSLINVGNGTGHVLVSQGGDPLALRTLTSSNTTFLTIQDSGEEITFGLNVSEDNTPDTLVARDSNGQVQVETVVADTAVELSDGAAGTPSLRFTSAPTVGLSCASGVLQFQTNALVRAHIQTTGLWRWLAYTTPGVLKTDSNGNIVSNLIGASDISGLLPDSVLAPISTPGKVLNSATSATGGTPVANTIVLRDSTGSTAFQTLVIYGQLSGISGSGNFPINCPFGNVELGLISPGGVHLGATTMTPTPTVYGSTLTSCALSAYNLYTLTGTSFQSVFQAPVIGSLTFAANTMRFGTVFQLRMRGMIVNAPTSSLNFEFKSNANAGAFSWSTVPLVTNAPIAVEVEACSASDGNMRMQASVRLNNQLVQMTSALVDAAWDPTVSNTLDLQAAWSIVGPTMDIYFAYVTVLNAV